MHPVLHRTLKRNLIEGGGVYVADATAFDLIDWTRPNQTIYFARGAVFRGKRADITGANIRLGAYGAGALPAFPQSTEITGDWTNTTGNIWSTPGPATSPTNLFVVATWTPQGITKFEKTTGTQTAPGSGEWGHASSIIYINSSADPNTLQVEHVTATTAADDIFRVLAGGSDIRDLGLYFGKNTGLSYVDSGASGAVSFGCQAVGCCMDGMSGGSGTTVPSNVTLFYPLAWYNGSGVKDGSGSDGDGISFHAASGLAAASSGIVVVGADLRYNTKSGVGCQSGVGITVSRGYFENNYTNFAVFPVVYTGGAVTQRLEYSKIVRRSNSATLEVAGVYLSPSPAEIAHTFRLEVVNCTIYSTNANAGTMGIRLGPNSATVTVYVRNCIVKGFGRGFQDTFNLATLDLDYNDLHGNTTAYYDNNVPAPGTLSGKAGAHSITGDPLFIDSSSDDFTLQSGSPCKNAGVDLGLTADYAGNLVPFGAAPDIGAYERQS